MDRLLQQLAAACTAQRLRNQLTLLPYPILTALLRLSLCSELRRLILTTELPRPIPTTEGHLLCRVRTTTAQPFPNCSPRQAVSLRPTRMTSNSTNKDICRAALHSTTMTTRGLLRRGLHTCLRRIYPQATIRCKTIWAHHLLHLRHLYTEWHTSPAEVLLWISATTRGNLSIVDHIHRHRTITWKRSTTHHHHSGTL